VQEVPISIPRAERSEAELGRIRAELATLPLESK